MSGIFAACAHLPLIPKKSGVRTDARAEARILTAVFCSFLILMFFLHPTHAHAHARVHTHTHTYIHTYIHTHARAYTRARRHTHGTYTTHCTRTHPIYTTHTHTADLNKLPLETFSGHLLVYNSFLAAK